MARGWDELVIKGELLGGGVVVDIKWSGDQD